MAFTRILAVVDETESGRRALRAAAEIAAAAHGELAPLRLIDEPWPFIEPGEVETKRALRGSAWQAVARERVGEQLRREVDLLPVRPTRVAALVRFGPPAVDIPRAAEDHNADLIVMGASPAGVADDVLLRTRVPCLIVPESWSGWRRLVVCGEVYREAFAFAELFRSDVVVVDAEPSLVTAGADRAETAARKAFAEWYRMPGTGDFDLVLREGDPAAHAIDVARAERADILVLGYSAGGDGAAVASNVAREATCAVLLVPV